MVASRWGADLRPWTERSTGLDGAVDRLGRSGWRGWTERLAERCNDQSMAASSAELSSLATALDELTRRVTVHADAANAAKDEETARELFAIERALNSANRRMARLSLTLGRR